MPGTNKALRAARTGYRYLRATQQLRAKGDPCWLCGGPIDRSAPPRHPQSFSADHDPPLNTAPPGQWHGQLRTAHYGCNSSAGDGTKKAHKTRSTTIRW